MEWKWRAYIGFFLYIDNVSLCKWVVFFFSFPDVVSLQTAMTLLLLLSCALVCVCPYKWIILTVSKTLWQRKTSLLCTTVRLFRPKWIILRRCHFLIWIRITFNSDNIFETILIYMQMKLLCVSICWFIQLIVYSNQNGCKPIYWSNQNWL